MLRISLIIAWLLVGLSNAAMALSPSAIQAYEGRQALEWRGIIVNLNEIMGYYQGENAIPIWANGTQLTANAQELLQAISRAKEDGLEATDYLPLATTQITGLNDAADAAGFELAMSAAFMNYARDLHAGRTTPSVSDPEIVIARKDADPKLWLAMAAQSGAQATLEKLVPQHRQYFQLRQLLAGYRALSERGGWPQVQTSEVLKPSNSSALVVELRRNLKARGYSGIDTADPTFYDEGLVPVVEHFQKRHGLDADGVVGPATYRALNVTAEERVRQIIVNMERWRWLPADLGDRNVFVNQAGFEMFTSDGGEVIDRRRVIVGKPFHKTPIFSDVIQYAEFNPTWTVPRSIIMRDKLAKIKTDPSFFDRGGYKLYSGSSEVNPYAIDWSTVTPNNFKYRLVQQPGPKNALGQVKFIFPNKFSVYLHDTPSRQLFARTGRAFSSGCIRINKVLDFAAILFGMDQNMSRAKVDNIVGSKKRQRVNLKRKVPVHLAYFTVWVGDNGVPNFFNDVYDRDKLVANILFGNV